MRAIVATQPGTPEVLVLENRNIPTPVKGQVLVKIKAFGLNRSEMFTRQGHSPGVEFPRVLGIECVGEVELDPSGRFKKGQQVAALMGGMGRKFDGGYAEYAVLPAKIILGFQSDLPWGTLGAVPEMLQTANGSLFQALSLKKGETILIRGGTSSVGMMAAQLAKNCGAKVIATTRSSEKEASLFQNGAYDVFIDDGTISKTVRAKYPDGVDKVLELVGTVTLKDSLLCCKEKGICCMTGILGNEWEMEGFRPMEHIPSTVRLTSYSGDSTNISEVELQDFLNDIEAGRIQLNIDRTFKMSEIVEAHHYMEANKAIGKLVVVV